MPDMLVNLLKLPSLDRLPDDSINIRRAQPFEIISGARIRQTKLLACLG